MAKKWSANDFETKQEKPKTFMDGPVLYPSKKVNTPKPKINDIFEDAPSSVSSLPLGRKQLNTKPMTDNIDLTPVSDAVLNGARKYSIEDWNRLSALDKIKVGIQQKKLGNYDYAPREELLKQEIEKQSNSKLGAGIAGFSNAASLGSFEAGAKLQAKPFNAPNVFEESERNSPISYNVGKMAGYIAPAVVGSGLAKPFTSKIVNPLLNRVVEGAVVGSGMTGIEDTFQGKSLGETGKDIALNAVLGAGLDVGLYGAGKLGSKIAKSAFPEWHTSFESRVQPKSARDLTFKKNGELVPQEGLLGIPAPRGTIEPLNMLPKGETPIEVGGYKDNVVPKVTIKKQKNNFIPMAERDFESVGNQKVKSYQQENPSVKPFIQQEAQTLKGELERGLLPNRGANYVNGEYIGFGNQSIQSDTVRQIKDLTGKSYEEINKAVEDIIADHGRENNALSKKIELIIDDRLTNGYTDDIQGIEIPPNPEYIVNKANFDEFTPKVKNEKIFSGYVNNKVQVQPKPAPIESISAGNLNKVQPIIDNTKVLPQYAREDIRPPNPVEVPKIEAPKPLETTQKPSLGATDRLHSMTQIVSSDESKVKPSLKDRWNNLYTRFVDSVSPTKKISENTHILATNTKNAGGIVDHILTENLVDREGNKIGESLKNIVKDIPENQQDDFMNYVLQKHNIDRAREGKHVYTDFTPEESAKAVKLIEQLHPEYKELNDRLVKFVRDFEDEWANKSGLITDEMWENLQETYKNYVPTQRNFDELEQGFSAANGRGFVDQGNTLKKATGSDRDIVNPLENIMKLVNKTVRTAKYNEVGQSMLQELRKNPSGLKHLAEIIPDTEVINPNVKNVVTVLEGGKTVNVRVNNKQLLEALQGITKANVGNIEAAVKKGTNVFKSLITTKNPVFAVRNIARDIPTAYINGSETNPIKFAKDLVKAGKDIVTNSKNYQQYKGVGGGASNFFKSDNTAKNVKELTNKSLLKKIGDGIERINNIIESAPRLAEFNRVLDKTGDVNKALFAASDVTTNFSRGGDITKHIDSFVPYLNAGVQGLDKLARQFVDKPIPTVAKGLVGITSMTLLLDYLNKDNPDYQSLDNRTKDNYFILPDVNKDGQFIKIPKSREFGVLFSDLFERTLRAARGQDNSFKGFGNTVATSFSPANPLEANIFSPALALKSNKDFANRDIVPRGMLEDNRSKYLQYDEKTSEVSKAIAEQAKKIGIDLSPKQMDYLIRSYTGVIGQLGLPATTKATMTGNTMQKLAKPVTSQFIADSLYSNQNITDFYDNYDKMKTLAADKNITQKVPSRIVTPEERFKNQFVKASSTMSDLNKKLREAEIKGNLEEVKKLRYKIIEAAMKANNSLKNYK